jgi:hypothetical protein
VPLYNNPHHTCTTYSVATTRDGGGGVTPTFTAVQSSVPCEINDASASTVELYSQQQIRVTHTVGILSSKLTTAITRGMKLADSGGRSFHIEGIRTGRAAGSVPAFTYCDCSELA